LFRIDQEDRVLLVKFDHYTSTLGTDMGVKWV